MSWAHRSVDPTHFVSKVNRNLFELLDSMYQSGKPIDLVTVQGNLSPSQRKNIDLEKLVKATDSVQRIGNIEHYAELMRKGSVSWRLERLYEELKTDPGDEEGQREVKRLWDEFAGRIGSAKTMPEAIDQYKRTLQDRAQHRYFRILTGFEKFDDIVGGFYEGNLVALGARTSLGKTTAFLHFAYRFLRQQAKVLFISAEMSCDEMLDRLVSMNCNIQAKDLRRGKINTEEMKRLYGRLDDFKELPMVWIEGGRMSLTRMRTAIQTYRPQIVFVDFIQRFTPSNPNMNRPAYFSDLVNEMKAISMEQKLICFAASQLSRAIELGDKRSPRLSDYKESGGIEEASDIAIAIHAVEEYDAKSEFREMEWLVLKNRHGPTGSVEFTFRKPYTQFFEKETRYDEMAAIRDGKEKAAGI